VLSEDRLTGLGMGGDTTIGKPVPPGGIGYHELEALNLKLGTGSDDLVIESTHAGSTNIDTGTAADTVTVKTIGGHTSIDTGQETTSSGWAATTACWIRSPDC